MKTDLKNLVQANKMVNSRDYGFPGTNTILIVNANATQEQILKMFQNLKNPHTLEAKKSPVQPPKAKIVFRKRTIRLHFRYKCT